MFQGTKNTQKIPKNPGKFLEVVWDMRDPNKIFGAHEKDFRAFYKIEIALGKRELNSGKIQKILGRTSSAPKRILKPFTLINTEMLQHECNTHNNNFILLRKTINVFPLYISCKETNVEKSFKIM